MIFVDFQVDSADVVDSSHEIVHKFSQIEMTGPRRPPVQMETSAFTFVQNNATGKFVKVPNDEIQSKISQTNSRVSPTFSNKENCEACQQVCSRTWFFPKLNLFFLT